MKLSHYVVIVTEKLFKWLLANMLCFHFIIPNLLDIRNIKSSMTKFISLITTTTTTTTTLISTEYIYGRVPRKLVNGCLNMNFIMKHIKFNFYKWCYTG